MSVIERWIDRGFGVASIFLVLMISYTLAKSTWFFLSPGALLSGIAQTPEVLQVSKPARVAEPDVAAIKQWSLFGKVAPVTARPEPKPVDLEVKAPETSLRLELKGVFVAETPSESSAIIAEKGREANSYKVGDRIPGNATLEAVHQNRVLLRRGGLLEALKFPEDLGGDNSISAADEAFPQEYGDGGIQEYGNENIENINENIEDAATFESAPTAMGVTMSNNLGSKINKGLSASPPGSGAPSPQNEKFTDLIGSSSPPSAKQLLTTLESNIQTNAQSTLNELGLGVSESGGYKVTENAPKTLLNMVGLRPGDIILSINGQTLGDLPQDQSLFQQLLTYDQITVEIQRGSRRFTVNLDLP